jgi:hypothetical protein
MTEMNLTNVSRSLIPDEDTCARDSRDMIAVVKKLVDERSIYVILLSCVTGEHLPIWRINWRIVRSVLMNVWTVDRVEMTAAIPALASATVLEHVNWTWKFIPISDYQTMCRLKKVLFWNHCLWRFMHVDELESRLDSRCSSAAPVR